MILALPTPPILSKIHGTINSKIGVLGASVILDYPKRGLKLLVASRYPSVLSTKVSILSTPTLKAILQTQMAMGFRIWSTQPRTRTVQTWLARPAPRVI